MITLVQGVPGSGKTLWAVQEIWMRLKAGQEVYTNVELTPYWPALMAGRGFRKHLMAHEDLMRDALRLQKLYTLIRGVEDLPTGMAPEGSRLCVIDEAQLIFNTRDATAEKRGGAWLKWFSQHRKFGFDVLLLAQDHRMLDFQLRALGEQLLTCFNLRRWSLPILFLATVPVGEIMTQLVGPMILRRCTMIGLKGARLWSDVSPIDKNIAAIYNTKQVYQLGEVRTDRGFVVDDKAQTAVPTHGAVPAAVLLRKALDTAYGPEQLGEQYRGWYDLWHRQVTAGMVESAPAPMAAMPWDPLDAIAA